MHGAVAHGHSLQQREVTGGTLQGLVLPSEMLSAFDNN